MKLMNCFSRRGIQLAFSLLSGLGYFFLIYRFICISVNTGGGFLGFIFAPAIICGAALYIIKSLRRFVEEKNTKALWFLFAANVIIFFVGTIQFISQL